jgi:hypothetical protein
VGVSAYVVDCECDEQIGRFRKKDAYDCGKTRCIICHGEKVLGITAMREIRADLDFREQLEEFRCCPLGGASTVTYEDILATHHGRKPI